MSDNNMLAVEGGDGAASNNGVNVDNDIDLDLLPDNRFYLKEAFECHADGVRIITEKLAQTELTLEERNLAYEEIHGVAPPIVETDDFVVRSLEALKTALTTTDFANKASYDRAVQKAPEYVHSRKMLLAFLRCDRFDIAAAAKRCVNYYALIEKVFGPDLLGRDIKLSNLDPASIRHLHESTHIQFLKQRDTIAGRMIQLLDPIYLMKMYSGSLEQELLCQKACFYLVMRTILDSEETQKNGVVTVLYGIDERIKENRDFKFPQGDRFLRSVGGGFAAVPVRVTAFHFLWNDQRLKPFMALIRHALGRFVNARFKSHFGSIRQVHQQLELYGIPVESIPLDCRGVLSYSRQCRLLRKHMIREQDLMEGQTLGVDWDAAVMLPTHKDVLLGRGRPFQDHTGNLRLREWIADNSVEYDTSTKRGAKAEIAQHGYHEVIRYGGRFLKLHEGSGWWFPVSEKEAIAKISQGFRKKREADRLYKNTGSEVSMVKKDISSGNYKRSKVVVPTHHGEEDHGTALVVNDGSVRALQDDAVWTDTLTNEEFDFLMEGLAAGTTRYGSSETSATGPPTSSSYDDVSDLISKDNDNSKEHADAFEEFLARVNDPDEGRTQNSDAYPTIVDIPMEASDPLLMFLKTHHNCLKTAPEECFQWLTSQDIVTMTDLNEACQDDEFVQLDLIASGGLKAFKRRPFIKAISNLL